jgi:hypothetical protein
MKMLKKSLLAAACLLVAALIGSSLMAQTAEVNADFVDLYIKYCQAAQADRGGVMAESGLDAQVFTALVTKVSGWAAINSQQLDDATKKAMLTSNPAFSFSDAELTALNAKADDVKAAYSHFIANP